jgi:hypothetical protein
MRVPEVKETRISRFLPCHVINMDQTPLTFELTTTGWTYTKKGNHTIFLRSGPLGWEKRHATLMIIIHVDSLPYTKLVLIYAGKEGSGNKKRRLKI